MVPNRCGVPPDAIPTFKDRQVRVQIVLPHNPVQGARNRLSGPMEYRGTGFDAVVCDQSLKRGIVCVRIRGLSLDPGSEIGATLLCGRDEKGKPPEIEI